LKHLREDDLASLLRFTHLIGVMFTRTPCILRQWQVSLSPETRCLSANYHMATCCNPDDHVQSIKDLISRQEGPPPGGFPAIRYARRLPSTGPTGATLFAVGAVVSAYGFYKIGVTNGKRRCVESNSVKLSLWLGEEMFQTFTDSDPGSSQSHRNGFAYTQQW
jgi:hypothetical protein